MFPWKEVHSASWLLSASAPPCTSAALSQARSAALEHAALAEQETAAAAQEHQAGADREWAARERADAARAEAACTDSVTTPHSLDDALLLHEAAIIANLHSHAIDVQNIHTLEPIHTWTPASTPNGVSSSSSPW
jgi:hypothetical protein